MTRPLSELADDELFCLAARTEESGNEEEAMRLFATLMQREPRPGLGRFSVGRLRLARGDETGIAMLASVMEVVPRTVVPGCEVIIRFLLAEGRELEARPYIDRYRRCQEAELRSASS